MNGKTSVEQLIPRTSLQSLWTIIENLEYQQENLNEVENQLNSSSEDNFHKIKSLYSDFSLSLKNLHKNLRKEYQSAIFKDISSKINPNFVKSIGLSYLNTKTLEKPIIKKELVNSITLNYWKSINKNVLSESKFKSPLNKLKTYYYKILDQRIENELKKVPIDIDKSMIEQYRQMYYSDPITFEEYLDLSKSKANGFLSKPTNNTESQQIREQFKLALEKKEHEQKKEKQMNSFDNYQEFFQMDERELKRAKRVGKTSKRKYTKKSRRGDF